MKTNTQDGRHPIPPLYVLLELKNGKMYSNPPPHATDIISWKVCRKTANASNMYS